LTRQFTIRSIDAHKVSTLTCDELAEALPYGPASQVTNILHQIVATSTTINQAGYLYNAVGNRTSLTDRRGSQAFGYDPFSLPMSRIG